MKNNIKKWLIVAGCLVICAVLIAVIGKNIRTDTVPDAPTTSAESTPETVIVSPETERISPSIVIKPETQTPVDSGADFSGTEQTIQPEVTKTPEPEKPDTAINTDEPHDIPTDPVLTNPAANPSDLPTPTPPPAVQPAPQQSGGLPGFADVPHGGANQVIPDDNMRENGNKIGIMD